MIITRDVINEYFGALLPVPNGNVLSREGFAALADWSEQQDWWKDFAGLHHLEADWRSSYLGDPNVFSLTLFRFIQGSSMKRAAKTLIADDSAYVLDVMEKLLHLRGIRDITRANSGHRALEHFQGALHSGSPYALVLLDIVMPGMDGRETLRRMRALEAEHGVSVERRAIIVMVSGIGSPDGMVQALLDDCTAYLAKPFKIEHLVALLARYDLV